MYGIVLPGPDVGEGGVPILKGGNVKPSRMSLHAMARTTAEIELPYARARLRPGDLVYSIRGSIGECELVPSELDAANITQDVARIAPAAGVEGRWLRWAMLSTPVREDLACGSLGAAVRGINIFDLKRANIPTPPLEEQRMLAEYLDQQVGRWDDLVSTTERAIGLLQERRTAIVTAAVSGQIDVRRLAAVEVS
jgi:type I restriction enzyme S subunit